MTPQSRAASVVHELGHALVGQRNGLEVLWLEVADRCGSAGRTVFVDPPNLLGRDILMVYLIHVQAGDIAARLIPVAPVDEPADAMALEAVALAQLSFDDADFVSYSGTPAGQRPGPRTDAEKAEAWARQLAGDDWEALLRERRPRAWQQVFDVAPEIVALAPTLARRSFMTGGDLAAAQATLVERSA